VLLKLLVPDTNCVTIGGTVGSTYDESRAVRTWLEKTGPRVSSSPPTSFTPGAFAGYSGKELKGTGVTVTVRAVAPLDYGATNWWTNVEGLIGFQNEVVKSVYYHLKYENATAGPRDF